MVRNNNMIPNCHFHKKWQRHIKMWFDQPMKKIRRGNIRVKKQIQSAPGPVQFLRPAVHCPSVRYNTKVRAGRGFSLQELKQAGINKKSARTIGIAVDYRRKNRCIESIARNVNRLKNYQNKLIMYPLKIKKVELTDSGKNLNKVKPPASKINAKIVTEEEKKFEAFVTLRRARADAKYLGVRIKRKISKTDVREGGKVSL